MLLPYDQCSLVALSCFFSESMFRVFVVNYSRDPTVPLCATFDCFLVMIVTLFVDQDCSHEYE